MENRESRIENREPANRVAGALSGSEFSIPRNSGNLLGRLASSLRRAAAATLGVMLTAPAVAMACPSCKSAIENDPVAAAFNSTTILMIAVPMGLVVSAGGWIFYAYWRARRAVDAGAHSGMAWRPVWTEKESET
jgi:hypothetical protein